MSDLRTELLELEEEAKELGLLNEKNELALAIVRVLSGQVTQAKTRRSHIPILVGKERCGGVGAYARDLAGNPYGHCVSCGGTFKLTKHGTLRYHKAGRIRAK